MKDNEKISDSQIEIVDFYKNAIEEKEINDQRTGPTSQFRGEEWARGAEAEQFIDRA